jgi:hypothetical protein
MDKSSHTTRNQPPVPSLTELTIAAESARSNPSSGSPSGYLKMGALGQLGSPLPCNKNRTGKIGVNLALLLMSGLIG